MSGENIEAVRVNRGFVQPACKIIYISPIRNGGWYGVLKMHREHKAFPSVEQLYINKALKMKISEQHLKVPRPVMTVV